MRWITLCSWHYIQMSVSEYWSCEVYIFKKISFFVFVSCFIPKRIIMDTSTSGGHLSCLNWLWYTIQINHVPKRHIEQDIWHQGPQDCRDWDNHGLRGQRVWQTLWQMSNFTPVFLNINRTTESNSHRVSPTLLPVSPTLLPVSPMLLACLVSQWADYLFPHPAELHKHATA